LPLFSLIELPFCKAILVDDWNSPRHRYFLAYANRDDFTHALGLPVVDEYCTFSSPIFFAAPTALGKIYNAGLTLCAKRSPDSDIDQGWPPLCIGTSDLESELPADFEAKLLGAIQSRNGKPHSEPAKVGDYEFETIQVGQILVFATNAPLLPGQLRRVCQRMDPPFSIAFSIANRITRQKNGQPLQMSAVSEKILSEILKVLS
jgi:hypothetical protein